MRWVAEALAVGLLLASALQVSGNDETDIDGRFQSGSLEVAAEQVGLEGSIDDIQQKAVDWEALWDAYIDGLFASCREGAMGSRCDAIGVDTRGAEPAAPVAPITIEDLAAFRPTVGELVVEPDGWGVVGTPTNFYATAESHTMQGELLGSQVTVRWTPTTYAFDYGDGTTQTTEGSGAAWRGTGEQWTETSTSHAYTSRDDVTASLTVTFTAEVDAGGGWFRVPGSLPVEAPAVPVKVFEVDTVLTAGDCAAAPTAPGCG
ncbi:hypothetical protein LG314_12910 [Agrococcus terreus]|uniref:hypothetical protein n=1 Tax=Agrococcus terreus TaxID=574649 RepID=UPI00384DFC37